MIFYNAYLEMERRNIVSIFALDSKTIGKLLSGQDPKYFDEEYPIFYRNKSKNEDEEFNTAIDVALLHNQTRAINYIIEHIIKF